MVIPFLQAIIGDMISVMAVVAILAGIYKLFQMATALNEIKDLLADIKRNTHTLPATSEPEGWRPLDDDSTESLHRAVGGSQPDADPHSEPSLLEP